MVRTNLWAGYGGGGGDSLGGGGAWCDPDAAPRESKRRLLGHLACVTNDSATVAVTGLDEELDEDGSPAFGLFLGDAPSWDEAAVPKAFA